MIHRIRLPRRRWEVTCVYSNNIHKYLDAGWQPFGRYGVNYDMRRRRWRRT